MAQLDDLKQELDALERARFLGARRVRHASGGSEREVEYRSDADMRAAINDLQSKIDRLEGGTRAATIVVRSSKGW
jgi:hypothetical protein